MVKGRRTRQTNASSLFVTASNTPDDTASPKRKDFKYDGNSQQQPPHPTGTKPLEGQEKDNGSKSSSVPLHTTQGNQRNSRSKTNGIERYFTNHKSMLETVKPSEIVEVSSKVNNFIDLTDENTCDSFGTNGSDGVTPDHPAVILASMGTINGQSPDANIFLQEPVLSLNVDEVATEKSRLVIQNAFLTSEIQSKFSPPKTVSNGLNVEGMWGNPSSTTDRALDLSKPTQVTEIDSTTFLNQENSNSSNSYDSADSGVVLLACTTASSMATTASVVATIGAGSLTTATITVNTPLNGALLIKSESNSGRRRKPTTPHRILCPSPEKSFLPIVASPSTALAHLHIQCKNRVARKNVKSKRRLHEKELENLQEVKAEVSGLTAATPPPVQGVSPAATSEACPDRQPVATMAVVSEASEVPTIAAAHDKKKPVLNDVVNPSAQQNTENNQSCKPSDASSGKSKLMGKCAPVAGNKKLTDFFQVRRSVRKTKKEVLWEREKDIEMAIREEREAGLKVVFFEGKGRGIVTTKKFTKGEFVVEYIGDLITVAEAKQREEVYAEDDNTGCYMYYFKHKNVQHCIDATAESGKLGRLVNHSRNGNLMTKTVTLNNRPHLVLLAKEDIPEGVEVTYDYGDRSKEALQHHPWLAF